ncbi:leucine-rich repeat domain-containing protein [Chitinophaga oryzae]|uniref:Leucine-rich repeat domain-containing protein n=1 Tax=Chitinophaga oryzae TaxID=2725414 RepID=A0AAE6ZJU0_9BACT|nr:leucine-rich repeat domain-containing protein [Chitinophaga oryzae]QJB32704.1 leucine-rich repeat domain-containing protein [Chitinophaga oryzae]
MKDLSKFIRYGDQKDLQIWDKWGEKDELDELPDDIFLQYPNAEEVGIHVTKMTVLPNSLYSLKNLKFLNISSNKIKTLPAEIIQLQQLESIRLNISSMDVNKGLPLLAQLPALRSINLSNWRGKAFPGNLQLLKHLTQLTIAKDKMTGLVPEILALLTALPDLQELDITVSEDDYYLLLSLQHMPLLDKLRKIDIGYDGLWRAAPHRTPLCLATTRQVQIHDAFKETLPQFRLKVKDKNYSDLHLQLLFGIHLKVVPAITELLPNQLANAIAAQQHPRLYLLARPKGESQKSINEKLEQYGISASNKQPDSNTIVVIGAGTTMEDLMPLLDTGCQVITTDQLKDVLINKDDHWLLQDDNEAANTQLMRLFTSNDPDNYQLAFEIIETGGANKIIQTLLAVVMLAHPDKTIHKKAEKLYDKYGSQAFRQQVKSSRISLRVGGNVSSKLQRIVSNKDVDEVMFRLMYQLVAGSNSNISKVKADSFSMKGIENITLPPEIAFFTQIADWDFENCKGFDIATAIPIFAEMPGVKHLRLNGCHIEIPASIGTLTQLHTLQIAHNTLAVEDSLQSLVHLKSLDATGIKLKNWDWLRSLKNLMGLMLSNNQLTAIPEAVFDMQQLILLEARNNKLTAVPEALAQLPKLDQLDFSSNQITAFPYFLGKYKLSELLLRSNKIQEVDTRQLATVSGGQPIAWEKLNLSRNELSSFDMTHCEFTTRVLDISHNQLTELHPSIFNAPLTDFYGHHNQISELPPIDSGSRFGDFWMQNNRLTELPVQIAHIFINNADFSNNQISRIHPDFDSQAAGSYSRWYWKMQNNPLPPGKNGSFFI